MTRGDLIEFGSTTNSKKVLWAHLPDFGMYHLKNFLTSAKFHLSKENHILRGRASGLAYRWY